MILMFYSIIHALCSHAQHRTDKIAFKFIESTNREQVITWGELCDRAELLATVIVGKSAPGDRVLLVYATGIEFVCAFLACAMAGVIAIPCFPPATPSFKAKLAAIIADARKRRINHMVFI
jgi:acyl-CoA synthetase (AMP-forming)/AMP-acid ligase II